VFSKQAGLFCNVRKNVLYEDRKMRRVNSDIEERERERERERDEQRDSEREKGRKR
jgi:hypothetical protein